MANRMAVLIGAVALAALGNGCDKAEAPMAPTAVKPEYTASSGGESTQLGRATFGDPSGEIFKVKRITGDWHIEVKAKPAFDWRCLAWCSSREARAGGTPIPARSSSRWCRAS
jgi:hypothetical protein